MFYKKLLASMFVFILVVCNFSSSNALTLAKVSSVSFEYPSRLLVIKGSVPNPCYTPVVTVFVNTFDKKIDITIISEKNKKTNICSQVIKNFTLKINLVSYFPTSNNINDSGNYSLFVNGVFKTNYKYVDLDK